MMKDWLKRYKEADAKLKRLYQEYQDAGCDIASGGVNYDGMPHGHKVVSQVEEDAIRLADLEIGIQRQMEECRLAKAEVITAIESLKNNDEKAVLYAVYVQSHPRDPKSKSHPTQWKYVAKMVSYSEVHARRIHNKAVEHLQELTETHDDRKMQKV